MLIVLYRQNRKEVDQLLKDLCSKLDISYTYQKECNRIILEKGLLHSIEIYGCFDDPTHLYGLRPDFYNTYNERAALILSQCASKVHGIRLEHVRDILKIIDILKVNWFWATNKTKGE